MTIKYLKIDDKERSVECSCGNGLPADVYSSMDEIHWWIVQHLVEGCKVPLTEQMEEMFNRSLKDVRIDTEG